MKQVEEVDGMLAVTDKYGNVESLTAAWDVPAVVQRLIDANPDKETELRATVNNLKAQKGLIHG